MVIRLIVALLLLAAVCAQKDYTDFVNTIKANIENKTGDFYHSAFNRLAYLSDTYGPRMWGSAALEQVIFEVASRAKKDGFDNVHLEPVANFTKWSRGNQALTLYSPRPFPQPLGLIGLGRSISGTVRAEAIVVRSFDELQKRQAEVKGKIVVYNQPWTTYYDTYMYRTQGAEHAAKYGAAAALVRSIASKSIYSVHAGVQYSKAIPIAAITIEDAEMMQRMQDRGQKIELELTLESKEEVGNSNNLIFEIKGTTKPDEILLMGGHIDSWDTGSQTGSNDDGGGFMTCYEAMRLILKSGFRPKRTLRFIAWSGEEFLDPKNGNQAYAKAHEHELNKHIVAFQDDQGSTKLLGFGYIGDPQGKKVVQMIGEKYMGILNASVVNDEGEMVDTGPLYEKGVPTMANVVFDTPDHEYYFSYHHSAGDSMTVMNADDLDSNVVGLAAMMYILADLDNTIPRPGLKNVKAN